MWLRKEKAGGAPGVTWEADGDVREVDDELGQDLLAIPAGGFTEVSAPDPDDDPDDDEDEDEDQLPPTGDAVPGGEDTGDGIADPGNAATAITEAPPTQATTRKPAARRSATGK